MLFFGMEGVFSALPLQALLRAGVTVCALVVPASWRQGPADQPKGQRPPPLRPLLAPTSRHGARPLLPVLNRALAVSPVALALQAGLPVWEVSRLQAEEAIATLAAYQPDVLCVACFPYRLPVPLLTLPRLGAINLHPSLLPALRGPEPLFWVFREGLSETGVTVHLLEERLDAGPIIDQERIGVPDGITYAELERRCALCGARLLVRAVQALAAGTARSYPQDEQRSSYRPAPSPADLLVPASDWPARRVYNFIRGVASWAGPLPVTSQQEMLFASDALAWWDPSAGRPLTSLPGALPATERLLPCGSGLVHLRLASGEAAHAVPASPEQS
uniref:Formyl transferase n=1 Tax=Thermogemmatispora argillosa TaxID=2045280 RepID=A0A455STW6_9CHLR|nr:formyl transferase [Thermogemmatispora argillosa]